MWQLEAVVELFFLGFIPSKNAETGKFGPRENAAGELGVGVGSFRWVGAGSVG